VAIWQDGAISGADYWVHICTSPELFIFVFFMMSDPQTAPRSSLGRIIYGAATAVVAAALVLVQTTEFGIKLAILSGLTVVCALVPLIELVARRIAEREKPTQAGDPRALWLRVRAGALTPAVIAVAIIVLTAVAGTAALARDKQVVAIERGLVGKRNAQ
jgi:uncharacterized membrane protein YhaH (DUF805 family)